MELKSAVYLVPPEARPPRPGVSRRAFLCGVASAGALGIAAGWVVGSSTPVRLPEGVSSTLRGDEFFAWALATQDGSLDKLVGDYPTFLMVFELWRDERLNLGMERLAHAVLDEDPATAAVRVELATSLAMSIEGLDPGHVLRPFAPQLRRAARR